MKLRNVDSQQEAGKQIRTNKMRFFGKKILNLSWILAYEARYCNEKDLAQAVNETEQNPTATRKMDW
jgi:hypothetical protein